MPEVDVTGLEILEEDECLRLLHTMKVGRVALTIGALPSIFPVNYAMVDGRIVFFTGAGSKLAAALHGAVVAFEVDSTNDMTREGWSVNVVGPAHLDPGITPRLRAELVGLESWVPDPLPFVVSIDARLISGRRLPERGSTGRRRIDGSDQEVAV